MELPEGSSTSVHPSELVPRMRDLGMCLLEP